MIEYACRTGEGPPPERKADMLYEIKWMVIEFLIRRNVLAVERVRVRGSHGFRKTMR